MTLNVLAPSFMRREHTNTKERSNIVNSARSKCEPYSYVGGLLRNSSATSLSGLIMDHIPLFENKIIHETTGGIQRTRISTENIRH